MLKTQGSLLQSGPTTELGVLEILLDFCTSFGHSPIVSNEGRRASWLRKSARFPTSYGFAIFFSQREYSFTVKYYSSWVPRQIVLTTSNYFDTRSVKRTCTSLCVLCRTKQSCYFYLNGIRNSFAFVLCITVVHLLIVCSSVCHSDTHACTYPYIYHSQPNAHS